MSRAQEHEIDFSQLFADVSRTVDGIKTMINPADAARSFADSPISKLLTGDVCFKTCGMEDIQFAARRAGEMLITMKACMLILTVIVILCMLSLTGVAIWYILKQRTSRDGRSSPLGSMVTDSSSFTSSKKAWVSHNANKN
ncbi:unnamed protein product [Toxocara canis]|uniref:Uncharacterized protein n=1 Tax=Toxocara canis TaxID=6265 RepID=A0A183UF26_TOXCA|nr:unnamed protein product [Toxocara canis]